MLAFHQLGWFNAPALQQLWRALNQGQAEARLVGGCVRNAWLGLPVLDVDLAINVPPTTTEALCAAAGIATHRTGFAHGTITAVVGESTYEITSLRADVATDGRRATVAYTTEWSADAARRDFSINALYLSRAGELYDYHHGVADLAARQLRFIGDPATRIAEDYLRILRYFRFFAAIEAATPDAAALAACVAAAPQMDYLSVERIWGELAKMLALPNPMPAVQLMQPAIWTHLLPTPIWPARLVALLAAERRYAAAPCALRRLAALAVTQQEQAEELATRWHLSNQEAKHLLALAEPPALDWFDAHAMRVALTEYERVVLQDWFLLVAGQQGLQLPTTWELLQRTPVPEFPITGGDVLALGVSGPAVGQVLRRAKSWWQAQGMGGRDTVLAQLPNFIK